MISAKEQPESFYRTLVDLLDSSDFKARSSKTNGLSGRGQVVSALLPKVGTVVIKQFSRGGLLRIFLEKTYLKARKVRAAREFELLIRSKELGINVPEAIAYAWKGRIFYRNWLVTREIPGAYGLSDLSYNDEDRARTLIPEVGRQIRLLIQNYICHVDLHPGNVVISEDGKVYLLDFDKATRFKGNRSKLRDYYLNRWRRAVLKHQLPEFLVELMSLELKIHFDDLS